MRTLEETIIDLWHISRTALSGKSQTRWDRIQYINFELNRTYPTLIKNYSYKKLWLYIEELTTQNY